MTFRRHLCRRISWFLSTETPHRQDIPPRLGPRTLAATFILPISVFLTHHFAQPWFLLVNAALLIVVVEDDLCTLRIFTLGMETGRTELIAEIVEAWQEKDIHPEEFLSREVWADAEEIEAARKKVRRSVRGRPPSG